MKRAAAVASLLVMLSGAALADAASEAARAELAREKRRLADDVRRLAETSRRLETALTVLSEASRAASDAEAAQDELSRREEALSAAEQEARGLLDQRRLLAERLADRRRNVAALEAELSGRPARRDALSGRWSVVVDPGEQRGFFRLALDGALVSGDYQLEGGFSGSLRGTLVEDRLRIERIDAKLGFNAVFYGRLMADGRSIAGTWEATTFGSGAAGAGQWRGSKQPEEAAP